jgi:hypothetical protein
MQEVGRGATVGAPFVEREDRGVAPKTRGAPTLVDVLISPFMAGRFNRVAIRAVALRRGQMAKLLGCLAATGGHGRGCGAARLPTQES